MGKLKRVNGNKNGTVFVCGVGVCMFLITVVLA